MVSYIILKGIILQNLQILCVEGKTQGHLGLTLLLLFNLKHTRKELPLETARKTHKIQHGNYLNLLHITRLSKHKLSYNFHTMNEAP